jgi:hypothetical protein
MRKTALHVHTENRNAASRAGSQHAVQDRRTRRPPCKPGRTGQPRAVHGIPRSASARLAVPEGLRGSHPSVCPHTCSASRRLRLSCSALALPRPPGGRTDVINPPAAASWRPTGAAAAAAGSRGRRRSPRRSTALKSRLQAPPGAAGSRIRSYGDGVAPPPPSLADRNGARQAAATIVTPRQTDGWTDGTDARRAAAAVAGIHVVKPRQAGRRRTDGRTDANTSMPGRGRAPAVNDALLDQTYYWPR